MVKVAGENKQAGTYAIGLLLEIRQDDQDKSVPGRFKSTRLQNHIGRQSGGDHVTVLTMWYTVTWGRATQAQALSGAYTSNRPLLVVHLPCPSRPLINKLQKYSL